MTGLNGFFPTTLILPFLAYTFFQHEVAEWAYDRAHGLRGSSASFGLFVDATAFIAQFGEYVLLIAYLYDHGWRKAVGLYAIFFLAGILLQAVPVLLSRTMAQGLLLFRLACLGGFYVTFFYICYRLSWFGLRSSAL